MYYNSLVKLFTLLAAACLLVSALPLDDSALTVTGRSPARIAERLQRARCSTNAECLKRGLPIHAPRIRRKLKARAAGDAPGPQGYLAISNATTNEFYGYVGNNGNSYYAPVTNTANAIIFNTPAFDTVTNIVINDASTSLTSGYKYLSGASDYRTQRNVDDNEFDFLFTAANQVARGPSQTVAGRLPDNQQETEIWSISSTDYTLSVSWVNADGTVVSPELFMYGTDFVGFVHNVKAYDENQGGQGVAQPVTLTLVPAVLP